jgi:hypothetical protein
VALIAVPAKAGALRDKGHSGVKKLPIQRLGDRPSWLRAFVV